MVVRLTFWVAISAVRMAETGVPPRFERIRRTSKLTILAVGKPWSMQILGDLERCVAFDADDTFRNTA